MILSIGLSLLLTMTTLETLPLSSIDYFDAEEYYVGPGDKIWISFPGGVPFSGASVNETVSVVVLPVALDGTLTVPTMPQINITGMNLRSLQQHIESIYSRSYYGLVVTSGLARSAIFQVPVTGQIQSPGIISVNGLTRLSEALSLAGGASPTAAISRVLIISVEHDSTLYDMNDFTLNGNMNSNPLMQRNSRIHLYPADEIIIVEGAISRPENDVLTTQIANPSERIVLEYIPGESAGAAIARSGGVSSLANLERCFLNRVDTDSVCTVIPFTIQGAESTILLQPGDRLVVPSSDEFINVTGEVVSPGPVLYSPGMTVNYYLGMASGFTSFARRGGLRVVLPGGLRLDSEMEDIVPPGSNIEVPRVAIKFWQEYLTIIMTTATIVITYHSITQ